MNGKLQNLPGKARRKPQVELQRWMLRSRDADNPADLLSRTAATDVRTFTNSVEKGTL
jgi:hypothetical protein